MFLDFVLFFDFEKYKLSKLDINLCLWVIWSCKNHNFQIKKSNTEQTFYFHIRFYVYTLYISSYYLFNIWHFYFSKSKCSRKSRNGKRAVKDVQQAKTTTQQNKITFMEKLKNCSLKFNSNILFVVAKKFSTAAGTINKKIEQKNFFNFDGNIFDDAYNG